MIKSMTGYGRGEYESGDKNFVAEIKSVNNRYRDIILRTPKALQEIEDEIRSKVSSKVRRGRVEVMIQIGKSNGESEYELDLNVPLIESYRKLFDKLADDYNFDRKVSVNDFCQMRDIIVVKPKEIDVDGIRAGLERALDLALESHDKMKVQEGRATEEDMIMRLGKVDEYVNRIEVKAPEVVETYRNRLKEKIALITEAVDPDDDRMLQEVAIFADKCDITEEIVRFRSHVEQFRKYLELDDSVGRRLDFIVQEMNREVNTMGTKASNSTISADAVEIKAEIEKIREQIQNVE